MKRDSLPWHKEYKITGIPKSLKPYPDKPVYEILYTAAKKFKKNGFIQFNHKMTYPEVKDRVDRLATALYNMGLRKGERIATILPTSIQFVIADYAISRAGLVHIPSSSLEPIPTLTHKFKEGTPRALITLDEHADIAAQVAKKSKLDYLILCRLDEYSNSGSGVSPKQKINVPKGTLWMTDLIDKTPPSPPEITFNVEKDLETLIFTGGTTGLAKGCMLTHRNIYANSMQNMWSFGMGGQLLAGAITNILGLPFFHSYGHIIMHTVTLFGHNQILVPDPRDTEGMIKMIKEHYPAIQIGVPTQFMKMSEELEGYGMLGVSGSAPLPTSTQEQFEKKAGGGIMEGYGLSEMSPCTHLNTTFLVRVFGGRTATRLNTMLMKIPGNLWLLNGLLRLAGTRNAGKFLTKFFYLMAKWTRKKPKPAKEGATVTVEKRGTIGIPFPDTEVKFLSVDSGKEISIEDMLNGERGEMILRGPQRMLGYWPQTGNGVDEDGYIHTSDVVRIDEKGYFYIVDRTKDMIIVSGYKVYSREIDDILYQNPKVELAATIGIPDPEREGSERIAVYIQPKERFIKNITPDEIIDFLKKRVAKYAVPKVVKIIETMPLTEVHKVNKKLLREMASKDMALHKTASGKGGKTKQKKKQKAKV
ncbi:MAG: AMP-dependent synthetase [Spirochaetes bacterium RBG_13_51_14]|nr:MAG: AMP-dependent synthetase [Spirochaetes bacterium RBG_13_51_14]